MENKGTLTLYHGRPENAGERLEKERAVYNLLDSMKIEYDRVDHEAVATIEACADVDLSLGMEICKNLFLCNRQKTEFYLLAMPGNKKFQTKVFSQAVGSSRLSFAPEELMLELMNLTPGSVSVLGLMNDHDNRVKLYIDRELVTEEYFGCHPCINTSTIKFRTADLLEKVLPAVKHEYTVVDLPTDAE